MHVLSSIGLFGAIRAKNTPAPCTLIKSRVDVYLVEITGTTRVAGASFAAEAAVVFETAD